jgi:choline dehydrogenase-like flavoprotein
MLASNLARSGKRPLVLLIEAGSKYTDPNMRVDGQRWTTFQKYPTMNWGYKTAPQKDCLDREIDYSRGRALGGSSAINFGVYTVGAKGDYDEWARSVRSDVFKWEHMQQRLKALETFHCEVPKGGEKYAASLSSNHGNSGPIHVGYPQEWEKDIMPLLDVFSEVGFPLNTDHNSGNPIGMAITINSAYSGMRSTAADALTSSPDNLTIRTDSPVQRLVVKGKRVVGIESNGKQCKFRPYYLRSHANSLVPDFASKDVILSAGALDSPKILLHSGIGPKDQLDKFGIPVIVNAPVGQGLRDHYFAPLIYSRTDTSTDRKEFYGNQTAMDSALDQWKTDRTGAWAKYGCETGIGWFKSGEISSSNEYKSLPAQEQQYLELPTVPHYEIMTHFPAHWFAPDYPTEHLNYATLAGFLYNSQARGEATLQSADPNMPLKFDPKVLSHPFDRRSAIETLRSAMRISEHPSFAKDTVATIAAPKSMSDEDILDYWKATVNSAWHMTGTVKMGDGTDPESVVDSEFRVRGIDNLRVADMSVLPVLPSAHTQVPAYLTGATCADVLIKEYGLE